MIPLFTECFEEPTKTPDSSLWVVWLIVAIVVTIVVITLILILCAYCLKHRTKESIRDFPYPSGMKCKQIITISCNELCLVITFNRSLSFNNKQHNTIECRFRRQKLRERVYYINRIVVKEGSAQTEC